MNKNNQLHNSSGVIIFFTFTLTFHLIFGINDYHQLQGVCAPENIQGIDGINCIGVNYIPNIIGFIFSIIFIVLAKTSKLKKWQAILAGILIVYLLAPFLFLIFISMAIQVALVPIVTVIIILIVLAVIYYKYRKRK